VRGKIKIKGSILWFIIFFLIFSSKVCSQNLLDINKAGFKEIKKLPGVSRVLAKRIVKYRDEIGGFSSIEDLLKVKGMNKEILNRIKPYIIVTRETIEEMEFIEEDEEGISTVAPDYTDLDSFLQNPLNINVALIEDLMLLPKIDNRLAREIIRYRAKRGRFRSVNELKNVKGMTDEIFSSILPYITVGVEKVQEEFHGDFRIRMGISMPYPDEYFEAERRFHHSAYNYYRIRIRYSDNIEFGNIVRKDDRGLALNYENLRRYFLVKSYIRMNNVLGVDKLILGNYQLSFGQGYIFGTPPFLVRRIPVKPRGLQEDRGTDYNAYFRGIAFLKNFDNNKIYFFLSSKPLIAELNEDGSVKSDLINIHDYSLVYLDYYNDSNIDNFNTLKENIIGGRFETLLNGNNLGVTFYSSEFSRVIDPKSYDKYEGPYVFHGDKRRAFGIDFVYPLSGKSDLYFEFGNLYYHGFTEENGMRNWKWNNATSFLFMPIFRFYPYSFWFNYHRISPDYYMEHSNIWVSIACEYPFNEEGGIIGGKYKGRSMESSLSFDIARRLAYSKYSKTNSVMKHYMKLWWDLKYKLRYPRITFYIKEQDYWYERAATSYEPSEVQSALGDKDSPYHAAKTRLQITYSPSSLLSLRVRYEERRNTFTDIDYQMKGYITFGEIKYKPSRIFTINSRIMYFDAPRGTTVGALEYLWHRVLTSFYWFTPTGGGNGYKFYIMPNLKLSRNTSIWLKYEYAYYYGDEIEEEADKIINRVDHVFRLQYDVKW